MLKSSYKLRIKCSNQNDFPLKKKSSKGEATNDSEAVKGKKFPIFRFLGHSGTFSVLVLQQERVGYGIEN